MRFFLDSVDVDQIQTALATGFIDGLTTNPSLMAHLRNSWREHIQTITEMVQGPISVEVTEHETEAMINEGRMLHRIAPTKIVVKLPLTDSGLQACRRLRDDDIPTNMTLCFSLRQALMAAKAYATYVSPFIGRLEDVGTDGITMIEDMREIYDRYGFNTQILAASIRSVEHVEEAMNAGADIATLPPTVFSGLAKHPLTDQGLSQFRADWARGATDNPIE